MTATLGILLSGSGTTYENLIPHAQALGLPIGVVIGSRANLGGLQRAAGHSHPWAVARENAEISDLLRQHNCAWVLMCGWLRHYDPPADFAGKVLNIHPSLLPSFGGKGFYGDRVHQAVLDAGLPLSGCSVHVVAGDYDSGPILAQRTVSVSAEDTVDSLRQRVQAAERHLYPLVLASIVRHGILGSGRRRWLRAVPGVDEQDRGFAHPE